MGSSGSFDLQEVKTKAAGQWSAIVQKVAGVSGNLLTGDRGPCPKCGGSSNSDRWRVFEDFEETGGGICNKCGSFADGFDLIRWIKGSTLDESISLVGEVLGLQSKIKKRRSRSKETESDPAQHLDWQPWSDDAAKFWATKKKPISAAILNRVDAKMAMYRKKHPVIALPVRGASSETIGWCIYHRTGKTLPAWTNGAGSEPEQVKLKITSGSLPGWIGPPIGKDAKVIWKVEGPSDLLAMLSLDIPADHYVVTNAFGAKENPAKCEWLEEVFRGATCFVVHDCDQPGQDGAMYVSSGADRSRPGWAPAIATVAREVRNIVLPYPIEPTHGKDLRDWIVEQSEFGLNNKLIYKKLLDMAEQSSIVKAAELKTSAEMSFEQERYAVDDPYRLAELNLQRYRDNYKKELKYWKETWFSWTNGVYEEMSADHLRTRISKAIKEEFDLIQEAEAKRYFAWRNSNKYEEKLDRGCPKARKVTTALVNNVYEATKGLTLLRNEQEIHSWINRDVKGYCISAGNGILNISKAIDDSMEHPIEEILMPHTPDWFSTSKLDFDFNPNAQCPHWCNFLADVFNGDEGSIDCLQKWFGYMLTPDNSLNKILFVIGEPRSGKGTIIHVMSSLFGRKNIATPTLTDFAGDYPLQSLLDKTVAIIPDARVSDRADLTRITERLLSISGGDGQTINRKYRDALQNYAMKIRFCIFSNMLPKLKDPSAAVLSRFIFLRMPNSYLGREDYGLKDRLLAELPGILNWSIIGRHLLNKSKRIQQPKFADSLVREMRTMLSPVLEFIDERCSIKEGNSIDVRVMFSDWSRFCEEADVAHAGNIQTFSRKVIAIKPNLFIEDYRTADGEIRKKFVGVTTK